MIHIAGTGPKYAQGSDGGPVILSVRSGLYDTLCGILLAPSDADRGRTVLPLGHPDACPACLSALPSSTYAYKVPVRLRSVPAALLHVQNTEARA